MYLLLYQCINIVVPNLPLPQYDINFLKGYDETFMLHEQVNFC